MIDMNDTSGKIITALNRTPMLLVLVLLNLSGLAMIAFLIRESAELRFKERAELVAALRECTSIRSKKD